MTHMGMLMDVANDWFYVEVDVSMVVPRLNLVSKPGKFNDIFVLLLPSIIHSHAYNICINTL